jgi:hypothetical protein
MPAGRRGTVASSVSWPDIWPRPMKRPWHGKATSPQIAAISTDIRHGPGAFALYPGFVGRASRLRGLALADKDRSIQSAIAIS